MEIFAFPASQLKTNYLVKSGFQQKLISFDQIFESLFHLLTLGKSYYLAIFNIRFDRV